MRNILIAMLLLSSLCYSKDKEKLSLKDKVVGTWKVGKETVHIYHTGRIETATKVGVWQESNKGVIVIDWPMKKEMIFFRGEKMYWINPNTQKQLKFKKLKKKRKKGQ